MSKREMLFVITVLMVTVAAVSALAALAGTAVARAEPEAQFEVRLTDVEPEGRFTLEFDVRTFDTTGAVPPALRRRRRPDRRAPDDREPARSAGASRSDAPAPTRTRASSTRG